MGIQRIGIVSNELRGNNCDDLDLARLSVSDANPSPTQATPAARRDAIATPLRHVITVDMLWTHHWADQHDRCVSVHDRLICRRCLVLYPVTLVVLVLARFGIQWPQSLDAFLLFALPLPLVLDFVLEHMGFTRYSPRRQIATTVLGAIALGHALARYLERNSDPLFWTMIAGYSGLCAGALAVHHLRDRRATQQRADALEAADPLVNGFANREEMLVYLGQAQN